MGKENEPENDDWSFALDDQPIHKRNKSKSRMFNHSRPSETYTLSKQWFVCSRKEDLNLLTPAIENLHLTKQDVVNIKFLKGVIRTCPNLRIVEVAEAEYDRLVKSGIKNLLEDNSIELRRGNMVQRDNEGVRKTPDYEAKKRAFEDMFKDPEKISQYQNMLEYEMVEADIALAYFGENAQSIRHIALDLGLTQWFVSRKLSGFLQWIGFPLTDKQATDPTTNLARKIAQLNETKHSESIRNMYAVKDTPPPEALPRGRWEGWKDVSSLLNISPDKFESLKKDDPGALHCLINYFQIKNLGGEKMTLNEIGAGIGITREGARRAKNRALSKLGLLDQ